MTLPCRRGSRETAGSRADGRRAGICLGPRSAPATPRLPRGVIVVGAGSGQRAGALKLGHFAALRWTTTTAHQPDHGGSEKLGEPLAEVFLGGEGLVRGPVEVLGTLLHEAAHAVADVRGIEDTSRQGRWHNAKFKALAEELGLEVQDDRIGWSPTSLWSLASAQLDGTPQAQGSPELLDDVAVGLAARDEEADPASVRVRVPAAHPRRPLGCTATDVGPTGGSTRPV